MPYASALSFIPLIGLGIAVVAIFLIQAYDQNEAHRNQRQEENQRQNPRNQRQQENQRQNPQPRNASRPKRRKENPCFCFDNENTDLKVYISKCGHWFHLECIRKAYNEKSTCPFCNEIYAMNDLRIPENSIKCS